MTPGGAEATAGAETATNETARAEPAANAADKYTTLLSPPRD
ncbi:MULTISPECIES: hypothetical protein [Haloarcula]|nr:hypothetical protein [Halomicroarcula sp. XH51]